MGEWLIYGSNGVAKATVKKLEYNGEFMGETIVTCDVYSPSPISFSVGDYLSYRGENFVIDYDATRKKQSRVNTYGNGFVYEGMKFTSYVGELKKCDFLDFVLNDNLQHYSQLPTFDFYAETVEALADRLQANLNRMYTGSKAWTVSVVSGFEGKENVNVQISNIKCFDALKMAYEQFNAQYVIRGRHIYIGTAGSSLETTFRYGIGNGLKTIERSVDENDSLVTRLRAYGNTTNLPSNYYANKGRGCYAPIFEVYALYDSGADIHFKPKFANNWFTEKSGSSGINFWASVSLDKKLWLEGVVSPNVTVSSVDFSVVSVMAGGNNTTDMYNAFKSQLQNATQNTKLYFSKGVNYTNWKSDWKETDEYMPNMMSIDRLMIPGFPEESTDPYIDSANISSLGIREKSVYFDGSEDELPDIHPSMEGMTAAELRAAGYTIDLDTGDNGNLDEIAADATELDGSAITTNGTFVEVNEVPGFKVTLKDIGFDINSYLSGDTATLSMKSGMCGGRDFTIVKVTKLGNKYVLECQRVGDANYYFPYNPYNIKKGDKFVLTNIEMPQAYIDAASQRLLVAAQEYLAKHSVPQWVYSIKMDDIWMQRQRDDSESESESYYWNIKEGDIMSVQDSDLGIDVSEVIDKLTIREGYSQIPEFEVVLRKEKPQGTIGILQNRIKTLERENREQANTIIRQQDYITLILGDRINDIQTQVDNVQVSYFEDGIPTLSNYPASTWNVSEYPDHVHDMYYDKTTGKAYEFEQNGSSYAWTLIQDEDIIQALQDASIAQDTADGKRRVFVTPAGTLPTPPYDENDLWMNATYPSNSTSTDESQHKYYNDILKCVTPKAEGATASINDWSLGSKYTDDSSLNAFISGTYADDLQDIQNQIDGKAETWYQNTDPSTAWTTTALKNQHKGDIWHNSSNTTINGVKAGQDAIWNGTAWVVDETVPQAVYDTIDGKAAIYVTWGAWGNDLQVKDLFIPAADVTQGGVTYKANKVYRCTNKTTPTFQEIAYTDDAALNAFLNGYTGTLTGIRQDITNAATAASNAQTSANNANTAAAAAQATADALDYLKQAYLADNTLIDHGLILSTIVALRDSSNNVKSGISGAYDSTKLGNGIAAWYGGGMIDKEVSAVANAAKSLFRFDGSGYVANGNLKWDASGNVTIQGYSINATTLQVGGSNVATQSMLDNFVSKAFFNRLFTAYDANGNAIVPNDTTTAINNLKIMVGAWTEQYLSALGLNSEGGGGGGTGSVNSIKVATNTYLDPDSDGIIDMSNYVSTAADRANWNTAYSQRHTHSNKSVLDGITSAKVTSWDNVAKIMEDDADAIINKWDEIIDFLDGIPDQSTLAEILAAKANTSTTVTNVAYASKKLQKTINGTTTDIVSASTLFSDGLPTNTTKNYVLAAPSNAAGTPTFRALVGADLPDLSATYATASRATTLEGYFTNGVANNAAKLNGQAASYYATASSVTTLQGYFTNGVANSAAKLNTGTTTYTAWGQTYWSSGVPQSISGNMTSVGSITPSANGNALGTTSARFNIYGTAGNFSGNVSISGTLGVTGATTLTGLLTANGNIKTGTSNGAYIQIGAIKLVYDSTNNALKVIKSDDSSANFYATGAVSALGANSSGGSSTFDEDSMWAALGTTSSAQVIASSHIPNLSWNKITSNKPTTLSGYGILDAYTKTQVDNALGGYLPLTGGTLTGTLTALNYSVKFDIDTSRELGLAWLNTSGTRVASVTYHNTAQNIIINPIGSDNTYSDAVGKYSLFIGNNKLTYNTYTILHSNNTYVSSGKGYINGTEITTISGNAATASTLATSRTLWGQSFDGSSNVSGNLSSVGNITPSANGNNLGTSSARFNIYGTAGNFSSNVSISGTLGVTGITTFSDSVNIPANKYNYTTDSTSYGINMNNSDLVGVNGIFTADMADSYLEGFNFKRTNGNWDSLRAKDGVFYFGSNSGASESVNIQPTGSGTDFGLFLNGTSYSMGFIIGSGNTNRGIYDSANGSWLLYFDASNTHANYGNLISNGNIVTNSANGSYVQIGAIRLVYDSSNNALKVVKSDGTTAANFYATGEVSAQGLSSLSLPTYLEVNSQSTYNINTLYNSGMFEISRGTNLPSGAQYGVALIFPYRKPTGNTTPDFAGQLYIPAGDDTSYPDSMFYRTSISASWRTWQRVQATSMSDERLKNKIGDVELSVKDIAEAPALKFTWKKDRDDRRNHAGSYAQYWLDCLPEVVEEEYGGYYSMQYGQAALLSAISIAKEVVKHENEITRLKKEVVKQAGEIVDLKNKVRELERRA